ncbi:hypothetical protein BDF20DRAFT_917220 [Mycotypha africana]|uniref:uncharacterized protein n=1 Tax=Mycotypha africana TaxID=64632 RepID=UPI0023011196|nr:uncharacterized protein BDF20DRAFT_917220 [Mycotypha africana]KAI8967980.1 hypothetical protein BDF20DRAFT_917220 [Mycotypha africana]
MEQSTLAMEKSDQTAETSCSSVLNVPDVTMTAQAFRQCIFVIDELLSCYDCYQFLIPIPATAFVYLKEIERPMDFKTLEQNLYNNKYRQYEDFIADLSLIWKNAKRFHRTFDPIYQQAENLAKRYESLERFLNGGDLPFYLSTSINSTDIITGTELPEEKVDLIPPPPPLPPFPMYKEIDPKRKSNLYFIQALSEQDGLTRRLRGFGNVRQLFQHLNSSFFQYLNTQQTKTTKIPLPRFYIAKNRTLLNQSRTDPDGLLAILFNVEIHSEGKSASKDLYRLSTTVVICEPMGETHNFDDSTMDKSQKYEYCPKAWLKLKILKVVPNVEAVINSEIDRNFFRKAYNTFRLSTKFPADPKKVRNQELAKQFVRSILEPVSKEGKPASVTSTSQSSRKLTTQKQASPSAIEYIKKPVVRIQTPPPLSPQRQNLTAKSIEPSQLQESVSTSSSPKQPASKPTATTTTAISSASISKPKNFIRIPERSIKNDQSMTEESKPLTERRETTPVKPQIRLKLNSSSSNNKKVSEMTASPTISTVSAQTGSNTQPTTQPNTQSETKQPIKDKNSGYTSCSTESYEYSEEEEDDRSSSKSKQMTPVDRKHDASLSDTPTLEKAVKWINDNPIDSFQRYLQMDDEIPKSSAETQLHNKEYYINASKELWHKLSDFAKEKNVPIVNIDHYNVNTSRLPNAEGFFKHVFFMPNDDQKVIQTFRRMTITQRTTEIAGLLALKGLPHVGQITEVLQESHGEIIGLCMQRYQKTLKQYAHAHSHHRLTAHQKMDIIIQLLQSIETIHNIGLAHRDISEVNFMVNETTQTLRDGSRKAELFLIDFGKSTFTNPESYRRWWVEQPVKINDEYEGEIVPKSKEELDRWCHLLPWMRSKPDHGYRLYRSIQTLPKSRIDTDDLPWLVNPLAEDLYSIGTLIWKTFAETEPWYGILDTDLKGLRETVGQDYHIEKALEREVPGELSKELLLKFLKVSPDQRKSATEVLEWLQNLDIQDGLINEWEQYAPVARQKRHAKALFRYEDEQAADFETRKRQKINPSK